MELATLTPSPKAPVAKRHTLGIATAAIATAAIASALVTGIAGTKPLLVRGTLSFSGGIVARGSPEARGIPHWEPGVELTFISAQNPGSNPTAVTDAVGRFSLRLRPGRYRVVIAGPGAKAFRNGSPIQPQPNVIVVAAGRANQFPLAIEGR